MGPTTEIHRDIASCGDRAYVVGSAGLSVFDLSDPTSPQVIGSLDLPDEGWGVVATLEYCYMACGSAGVQVANISNSESPILYDNLVTPGHAYGVAIDFEHIFVADGSEGFHIGFQQCGDMTYVRTQHGGRDTVAELLNACPNPANPRTTIRYGLRERNAVSLRIFDLAGRLVDVLVDGEMMSAGTHTAMWNGRDAHDRSMPSGTYFYRLESDGFVETRRMTLIR